MKRFYVNTLIIAVLAVSAAFVSCNKDDDKGGGKGNVYVAGSENNGVGKVWKDGKLLHTLTDGTRYISAESVYVSGDDVYVAGTSMSGTGNSAKLWKNGEIQTLTGGYESSSVFVSGNDVYVAGCKRSAPNRFATYWKNGEAHDLTNLDMNSNAYSIFVSGSDVYVAGFLSSAASIPSARLWKNGEIQPALTNGRYAYSVFVSGSDVYVAGEGRSSGQTDRPRLWKNGEEQDLKMTGISGGNSSNSYAYSVYVSGNDVYVAGQVGSNAVLWKNGEPQILDGYGAQSVYVSGKDVYVAGSFLWKNGDVQELNDSEDIYEFSSVFVN